MDATMAERFAAEKVSSVSAPRHPPSLSRLPDRQVPAPLLTWEGCLAPAYLGCVSCKAEWLHAAQKAFSQFAGVKDGVFALVAGLDDDLNGSPPPPLGVAAVEPEPTQVRRSVKFQFSISQQAGSAAQGAAQFATRCYRAPAATG
jgi:hypothetical protein